MPFKDKEKQREYQREYRRRERQMVKELKPKIILAKNGREATCVLQDISPPSDRYTCAGINQRNGKFQIQWVLKKEDTSFCEKTMEKR